MFYRENGKNLIPVHINCARDDSHYWNWDTKEKKWIRGRAIPDNLKRLYNEPPVIRAYFF